MILTPLSRCGTRRNLPAKPQIWALQEPFRGRGQSHWGCIERHQTLARGRMELAVIGSPLEVLVLNLTFVDELFLDDNLENA